MKSLKYINIPDYITISGKTTNIQLSYQIFGKSINDAPVVLVNHALTGNSEVIGKNGWWNELIGKDKCIDTNDYCILTFNVPGNGYTNTTDSLIENYKDFTARDIAKIFSIALEQLNISRLFAAIGGSVGGGIAWELAALKPNLIEHLIPVSTDWKSTDWLIANCHIQDAILNNSSEPLKDARMHAMTLYRTPESFTSKFKRSKRNEDLFNTESWLNHHGEKLNDRFNLSAYKLMNQLLKTIDITKNRGSFVEVASTISSHIHMITINSDLFFKPEENWKTLEELKGVKENVSIYVIDSIHGHDGFLIEFDQLAKFLNPVFQPNKFKNAS